MEYIKYFIPSELILKLIILGIIITGAIVLKKCNDLKKKVNENLDLLDENNPNNICNVTYLENSLKVNGTDSNAYFLAYAESKEHSEATEPLFEHLRAIYEAGHKSSRLDADLLVRNTIDKICSSTDTIKSFISLFLVFGILGTLVGLAISIGSFSGDGFIVSGDARNTAAELSNLFSNLRGAFAPSMWGVSATIAFVFYYSICVQEKCINKLTEKLTTVTINKWLPVLYPTDFQKGEISMSKLNDAVKDANESLENQIKFVDKTEEMFGNLIETNETIKELRNVSQILRESSMAYQTGSAKITEVKEALDVISQQVEANNEGFKTFVNGQIAGIKEIQKSCLDASLETKKTLLESSEKNITATDKLDSMHDDIVKSVSVPLQDQLTAMSENLQSNMNLVAERLDGITKAVNRINNPLDESAEKIQKIFRRAVDEIDKKNQMLLEQGGLSEDKANVIRDLMADRNSSFGSDNTELVEKLDKIAKHLENIEAKKGDTGSAKAPKETTMDIVKSYLPIAVVVLLLASICVQGMMVSKIDNLTRTQNAVTEILLKGDKN